MNPNEKWKLVNTAIDLMNLAYPILLGPDPVVLEEDLKILEAVITIISINNQKRRELFGKKEGGKDVREAAERHAGENGKREQNSPSGGQEIRASCGPELGHDEESGGEPEGVRGGILGDCGCSLLQGKE